MKKFVFLLPLLLLFSCNKTVMFTKTFDDFADNRWQKTDIKVFDFEIEKDVESASITLTFLHTVDPQYTLVPLHLTLVYPDANKDNMYLNLQLKDSSGNSISDCSGDSCELQMSIREAIPMPAGKYTIELENRFEQGYLPNVQSISINVENNN
ncbi:gliding motility lipoprotein GldH [Flavobacterium litorale]|uniref:Gliding motility lipoprotein GldH n=1 Tax=Flavobacterium litorale TaxID=2856519 RepID=A0ABX8V3A5_9FLAO|nr:gliding motility lipoprotein GldH [Flavobacterium litorale]QYJ67280.1 gliding motility lipoprotein GldH [Flavobacterium litorale]